MFKKTKVDLVPVKDGDYDVGAEEVAFHLHRILESKNTMVTSLITDDLVPLFQLAVSV